MTGNGPRPKCPGCETAMEYRAAKVDPYWECGRCGNTLEIDADGNPETEQDTDGVTYDSGEPIASTLGFFVSLLIDGGTDDAVIFRVVNQTEPDASGNFRHTVEVEVIPNGQVRERIEACGVEHVHKVLALAIERGIMK